MKSTALLLLTAALSISAQTKPASLRIAGAPQQPVVRIAQGTFTGLEKHFNDRLASLFPAGEAVDLLGNTRGVYLDGFGAVFTAEVSLVVTPTLSPFRKTISKELADSVRKKKLERLPFLQAVMKDMMRSMGTTFIQVPATQQMVLIVRFYYEPWEDMNGMPSQVLMRADRQSAMAGDVKVEVQ